MTCASEVSFWESSKCCGCVHQSKHGSSEPATTNIKLENSKDLLLCLQYRGHCNDKWWGNQRKANYLISRFNFITQLAWKIHNLTNYSDNLKHSKLEGVRNRWNKRALHDVIKATGKCKACFEPEMTSQNTDLSLSLSLRLSSRRRSISSCSCCRSLNCRSRSTSSSSNSNCRPLRHWNTTTTPVTLVSFAIQSWRHLVLDDSTKIVTGLHFEWYGRLVERRRKSNLVTTTRNTP